MTYFDIKISVNQWTFYKNGWINFLQAWEIHQYKYTFDFSIFSFITRFIRIENLNINTRSYRDVGICRVVKWYNKTFNNFDYDNKKATNRRRSFVEGAKWRYNQTNCRVVLCWILLPPTRKILRQHARGICYRNVAIYLCHYVTLLYMLTCNIFMSTWDITVNIRHELYCIYVMRPNY